MVIWCRSFVDGSWKEEYRFLYLVLVGWFMMVWLRIMESDCCI